MIGNCEAGGCDKRDVIINRWRGEGPRLCGKHYMRMKAMGSLEYMPSQPKPLDIHWSDAKWLAGVIDCDGWIGVMNSNGQYFAAVGVGNTRFALPEYIHSLTNVGTCNISERAGTRGKPIKTWRVSAYNDVRSLLTAVEPHLLLKREQASLVLSMPPKNSRESKKRDEIAKKLNALNKKGR